MSEAISSWSLIIWPNGPPVVPCFCLPFIALTAIRCSSVSSSIIGRRWCERRMSPYRFRIDRITDVHVLRGQIVIGCNVISGPGYVHVRPLFLSHRSMTMMLTGQKEEVHPQSSLALSTNLCVKVYYYVTVTCQPANIQMKKKKNKQTFFVYI